MQSTASLAAPAAPARRRLLLAALAAGALLAGYAAGADERIGVVDASLESDTDADPGVFLNAQFDFNLPPALEDAVGRGVALYFVVDFELSRRRWYWVDQKLADDSVSYRLSYSPLTRQYRLARGALAQPFDTLAEALATIRRVSRWKVLEPGQLRPEQRYDARVRLRLDTSLLPKPFQVNALTNRDWSLTSEWHPVPVGSDLAQ